MQSAPAANTATAPRTRTREERPSEPRAAWWQSTLALTLYGGALLWVALPPLEWTAMAWLAPVPWVLLIRRQELAGRRPYLMIWLGGFGFWMAALHWMTLPHWATAFGWVALSCYLAIYAVALIGLARFAVHSLGISAIIAAPVTWTGLELARAHLLSGFNMASIAHTQYRWTDLIQVSDTLGAYGVSFVMLFAGACLARMLPCDTSRRAWWPLAPLAGVLAVVLGYGSYRTHEQTTTPGPKIALIQGSIDIEMKYDAALSQQIFEQYYNLSREAIAGHPDVDLIVWPETMFRDPWYTFAEGYQPPENVRWTPPQIEEQARGQIALIVRRLGAACLFGIDTFHYKPDAIDHLNSALAVDRQGQVIGRYDKCHLVPFGEYVPFADRFPWLHHLTPLPNSSQAGDGARAFEVGQWRYAVDICYENTLPHFMRNQVAELRSQDREPELLVNLTNDGWFWGSSELDLHLACAVFRAVECRKPFLIAANTGFSAWIDSDGRVLAQGRRRATDWIIAEPQIDSRISSYSRWGDLPAAGCLAATLAVGILGVLSRWKARREGRAPRPPKSPI